MKFEIGKIKASVEVEAHLIYGKEYTDRDNSPAYVHFEVTGNTVHLTGFTCRSYKIIHCGSEMIVNKQLKAACNKVAEKAAKQIINPLLSLPAI